VKRNRVLVRSKMGRFAPEHHSVHLEITNRALSRKTAWRRMAAASTCSATGNPR
jgi:hypothetical protein